MTPLAPTTSAPSRPVFFLLFYAYFAFGVLLQVFPPLLDIVGQEFGVTHQATALIMTLFMAPLALLGVPAGVAVDRRSIASVGHLAFGLMLLGSTLTALPGPFPILPLGRVISGLGGGLLVIVLLKIMARTLPREQHGLALGIFAAGLPAGTGVAFKCAHPSRTCTRLAHHPDPRHADCLQRRDPFRVAGQARRHFCHSPWTNGESRRSAPQQ